MFYYFFNTDNWEVKVKWCVYRLLLKWVYNHKVNTKKFSRVQQLPASLVHIGSLRFQPKESGLERVNGFLFDFSNIQFYMIVKLFVCNVINITRIDDWARNGSNGKHV